MSSKTKTPAYLISGTGVITVHMNGKVYSANPKQSNYREVLEALKAKKWNKLPRLFDIASGIVKRGKKALKVVDGQILYGNEPVHNVVADRIVQFMKDGLDFKPLFNFLRKVLTNPSKNSQDNLYRFAEANDLPITWDGDLLCYKKLTDDYKDFKTKTFDNSVGKTVEMPREKVVDDPTVSCSSGLHVGGLHYARVTFEPGEGRIVLVRVNPADVVSVPYDYQSAKCRTCKYLVVEDYSKEEPLTQHEVMENDGWRNNPDYEDPEDEEDTQADNVPAQYGTNDCYY